MTRFLNLVALVAVVLVVWKFEAGGKKEYEDLARTEGYAAALADVAIVIAQGGGIDEVLDFAKRKSDAGFHEMDSSSLTNMLVPEENDNGRQSTVR